MESNNNNINEQQNNHHQISNPKPIIQYQQLPSDESPLDLYTIPLSSGWFAWDSIHDTERAALWEFFDGSSFTRSPRIYKEYRDFIINKFREDPSRKLLFTDVRKSLVGDVCLLRKVFNCLNNWGLINFNVGAENEEKAGEGDGVFKVRVEEGAPTGVRVVAMPNSVKPLVAPPLPAAKSGGGVLSNGLKLPLASYSDVFGDLDKEKAKELVCGSCMEKVRLSKYYESAKENYVICQKCFENRTFGENKLVDDFKLKDPLENKGDQGTIWSEPETLILLESVLKHGDDWDLVAQNVQTKTKQQCISKLIELPFGELMFGPHAKQPAKTVESDVSVIEPQELPVSEPQEIVKDKEDGLDMVLGSEHNGEAEDQGPPLKKRRVPMDLDRSLMKQVALISTMVSPRVTAAAADAAVLALCDGNPLVGDIFYAEDDTLACQLRSGNLNSELERVLLPEDSELKDDRSLSGENSTKQTKDSIPLALRMRAGTATALGAAAAHARLLANKEEREMEHLMATIVETQLKKLQRKLKHFEDLESIMEKEHAQLEELKESTLLERVHVLRKIFNAGIPRWRDNSLVKP